MKIRQTFTRGHEDEGFDDFMKEIPSDPVMQDALSTVFKVIRDNVLYEKFFVIQVDTTAMKAEVVEVA